MPFRSLVLESYLFSQDICFFMCFVFLFCLQQEEEFHKLILSLDRRGRREAELRQALEKKFDVAELERNVKDR